MTADTMFDVLLVTFLGLIVLCIKPLGGSIADVMAGRANFALRLGGGVEGPPYRLYGVVATVGESQ